MQLLTLLTMCSSSGYSHCAATHSAATHATHCAAAHAPHSVQAARLALSCLPHAHALNPNEIQRAILQCKEQSPAMLEAACLAIEGAAKGGGEELVWVIACALRVVLLIKVYRYNFMQF